MRARRLALDRGRRKKRRRWAAQKSPVWESEGEAWSEDESVSSGGSREGNVCNDALHVIGLSLFS